MHTITGSADKRGVVHFRCHGIEKALSLCCCAACARRPTMHDSGGGDEGDNSVPKLK